MRLIGYVSELDDDLANFNYEVVAAIVTDVHITVDWTEGGALLQLRATSVDGVEYTGSFGEERPDAAWPVEITRYTAKDGCVLLVMKWEQTDLGYGGWTLIELFEPDDG